MSAADAAFYFDLASPLAYLAAERILHVLPGAGRVAAGARARAARRRDARRPAAARRRRRSSARRSQRRAAELGLQPLRWPDPFPFDSALAMRVATYAKSIGRAVPFAQAAFRQAFAGGHSLEEPDYVLIAAAACEMHPAAVLRGAELRSVARAAVRRHRRGGAAPGSRDVPAVRVGEQRVPWRATRSRTRPQRIGLAQAR